MNELSAASVLANAIGDKKAAIQIKNARFFLDKIGILLCGDPSLVKIIHN